MFSASTTFTPEPTRASSHAALRLTFLGSCPGNRLHGPGSEVRCEAPASRWTPGLPKPRVVSPHPPARAAALPPRGPWVRHLPAARAFLTAAGVPGRPCPAEPAGSCQGARRGPGHGQRRDGPFFSGRAGVGCCPPARWALGPPPHGDAHPPSSPATVAGPRRAPPPCWLLFPFPESVASGVSANQGSLLCAGSANGIPPEVGTPDAPAQPQRLMGIVVHQRGHEGLSPRSSSQPHLPGTGNLRAHRRLLEARRGEEDRDGRGRTHGAVAAGEGREESGRCLGLIEALCVRASRGRAGPSGPQRLRLYSGGFRPDVAARI